MRSRPLVEFVVLSLALFSTVGCNPPAADEETTTDSGTSARSTQAAPGSDSAADSDSTRDFASAASPSTPSKGAPDESGGSDRPEGISLTISDPAPQLSIGKWMKGEPFESFQDGQVYVVEFWATWCGPCRVSMPHISQLQDEYGAKVSFVGVSDETEEDVQAFFEQVQDETTGKTWDQVVTYAIALDDTGKNTGKTYMQAAGQGGIPTAFIVGRDGRIEWIGHPMEIDEPLARVVGGSWDRQAARTEFHARLARQTFSRRLEQALREGRSTGDWSQLEAIVSEAEKMGYPPETIQQLKFDVALVSGKFAEAQLIAEEIVAANWEDAQRLNTLAWHLVTRVPTENQNHEQALRIAERASELTDHGDASILDTLAHVHHAAGDLQQSVEWQRKAVAIAPELQDTLTRYEEELAAASEGATPQSDAPAVNDESTQTDDPAPTDDSAPVDEGSSARP
jgi:thiol-disulfide isomerase/thioredoxin